MLAKYHTATQLDRGRPAFLSLYTLYEGSMKAESYGPSSSLYSPQTVNNALADHRQSTSTDLSSLTATYLGGFEVLARGSGALSLAQAVYVVLV